MRILFGLILVMVGIVGLLVPVMPGWLFIFPGLALISPDRGQQLAEKLKKKVQSISSYFD